MDRSRCGISRLKDFPFSSAPAPAKLFCPFLKLNRLLKNGGHVVFRETVATMKKAPKNTQAKKQQKKKAQLDDLVERLDELENEFEERLGEQRDLQDYTVEDGRATFTTETIAEQQLTKTSLLTYLKNARIIAMLSAPVVYALLVPFVLLDASVTLYMLICFWAWQIHYVKRSDYIVIDRHYLPYLNPIQKVHCIYCGYINGLVAYVREVTAQTEKFWCPIKHAARVADSHNHYRSFMEYGDAEDHRDRLEQFRDTLRKEQYRRTKQDNDKKSGT